MPQTALVFFQKKKNPEKQPKQPNQKPKQNTQPPSPPPQTQTKETPKTDIWDILGPKPKAYKYMWPQP